MRHDDERRKEAIAAGEVLGFTPLFLPDPHTARPWLLEQIEREAPQALITHSSSDPHFEHAETHADILRALTKSKSRRRTPLRWYAFDTYYLAQQPPGCPVLVDISVHFRQKSEALRCHQSQPVDELLRMAESTNRLRGLQRRCEYAEAFHPFPLLGRWPILRNLP